MDPPQFGSPYVAGRDCITGAAGNLVHTLKWAHIEIPHEPIDMTTVKQCIDPKNKSIFSVRSTDSTEDALKLMRDKRVRAILVVDDDQLVGIVSQGDCSIRVLLPHRDPKLTRIAEIMSPNPLTVSPSNTLDECMAIMVHKHIRHLPVLEHNKVIGVVSIGDIVKNIIELQGSQIKFLETYIKGHGN